MLTDLTRYWRTPSAMPYLRNASRTSAASSAKTASIIAPSRPSARAPALPRLRCRIERWRDRRMSAERMPCAENTGADTGITTERTPASRANGAAGPPPAAKEVLGVEKPERQIGVGHGRPRTAAAIAGGPGKRAGALGAHL